VRRRVFTKLLGHGPDVSTDRLARRPNDGRFVSRGARDGCPILPSTRHPREEGLFQSPTGVADAARPPGEREGPGCSRTVSSSGERQLIKKDKSKCLPTQNVTNIRALSASLPTKARSAKRRRVPTTITFHATSRYAANLKQDITTSTSASTKCNGPDAQCNLFGRSRCGASCHPTSTLS